MKTTDKAPQPDIQPSAGPQANGHPDAQVETKRAKAARGIAAKGNQRATTHGGWGAVQRIHDGTEFIGIAAEAERAVQTELEASGRYALVVRNARRLQAAADLFWGAVSTAAEHADLEGLTRYIKTYGWLAASSLRAWAQVQAERPDDADVLDYETLLAAQRKAEAEPHSDGGDTEGGEEHGS